MQMTKRDLMMVAGNKVSREVADAMAKRGIGTPECLRLSFPSTAVLRNKWESKGKETLPLNSHISMLDISFSSKTEMEKMDVILRNETHETLQIVASSTTPHISDLNGLATWNYLVEPSPYSEGKWAKARLPICWIRLENILTKCWVAIGPESNELEKQSDLEPELQELKNLFEKTSFAQEGFHKKALRAKSIGRRQIKGIIFDLDGTLIHLPINYERLRKRLYSRTRLSERVHITEMMEITNDEIRMELFEIWKSEEMKALPLSTIIEQGMSLYSQYSDRPKALVTMHSRKTARLIMKRFKLTFDDIVCREDSLNRYDQIMIAIEKLGRKSEIDPGEILMCGDRLVDKIAAGMAGCQFEKIQRSAP